MKTLQPAACCLALAALLATGLALVPRPARAASALEEAITAYENFEYEEALRMLDDAAQTPGNSGADQARILLYQGLIHFTLGDRDLAEREFESALKRDRRIRPPQDTSPKIISAFEAVRAKLPAPQVRGPDTRDPDRDRPPHKLVADPPPPVRSSGRVWTWVAIGVGGAALAGGGAFAGLAAQAKGQFDDAEWAARAADLKDTVETRALAANILFGVGGAALLTGVILFFVEDGGGADKPDQTAVRIEPGPLSIQATVRF